MTTTATKAVAVVSPEPVLPDAVTRRGVSEAEWRTLCNSLYPGANPNSVLMVLDYCRARQLDPMKKPCHIVPMRVKDAQGQWGWRDVVMPGIYEYRTTAQRTGEYLGHSRPAYGPVVNFLGLEAPEWCELTVYRWNTKAGQKVEFPVRTYFREVVATTRDGKPNDRWSKAPIQMLSKCCEAAALREAFPDELGGEPTFEEMVDQHRNGDTPTPVAPPETAWAAFSTVEQEALSESFKVTGVRLAHQHVLLRKHTGDIDGLMEELRRTYDVPTENDSHDQTPTADAAPVPVTCPECGTPTVADRPDLTYEEKLCRTCLDMREQEVDRVSAGR